MKVNLIPEEFDRCFLVETSVACSLFPLARGVLIEKPGGLKDDMDAASRWI
jgi:hypothetical protein